MRNIQVEVCMHEICDVHSKKCNDTNHDICLAWLQVRSTPIGAGLPSIATVLFIRATERLLPKINIVPINIENDDAKYEALEAHLKKIL